MLRVADVASVAADLELRAPIESTSTEVALPSGLVVKIVGDDDAAPSRPIVSFCAADLRTAAEEAQRLHDSLDSPASFTVDPRTLRTRSVVLATPTLLIAAVHCIRAEEAGVPCDQDCSPHRTSMH